MERSGAVIVVRQAPRPDRGGHHEAEPRDPSLEVLARQPLPQRLFLWHTRKWLEARIGPLPRQQKTQPRPRGQHEFRFMLPS